MIFHLVSRIHRREHLLVPELRTTVAGLIATSIGRTDARLLAYAVMPSHVHILLRQGYSRLGVVMQPLLRRLAYRVQAYHGFEGTVFERRYRDRLCETPDHVREALMYTHLNPWRAGLCGDDLEYPWATQRAYLMGADSSQFGIQPHAQTRVLGLFALTDRVDRESLCHGYATWLQWRMSQDRAAEDDKPTAIAPDPPLRPNSCRGDSAWTLHFATGQAYGSSGRPEPLLDLRDYVATQLIGRPSGSTLQDLRGRRIPRRLVPLRRRLIRSAAEVGYRTTDVAAFFQVSPAAVSRARYARAE